jgi:hypothetical protein
MFIFLTSIHQLELSFFKHYLEDLSVSKGEYVMSKMKKECKWVVTTRHNFRGTERITHNRQEVEQLDVNHYKCPVET